MEKRVFGYLPSGEQVDLFTLKSKDVTVRLMPMGATLVDFIIDGVNIVGGFDTLGDYLKDTSNQGAVIGRVANRIGGAKFTMDGTEYTLPKNDGNNTLHGGVGFNHRLWTVEETGEDFVTFSYRSPDGEEGFPGALRVVVTYRLDKTALLIEYQAYPEAKTPIALTNHAYFNLNGLGDTVDTHTAVIYADRYTAVNEELIPNGIRPDVKGTVFDFTEPHTIGERLGNGFIGYDNNYILRADTTERLFDKNLFPAAWVEGNTLRLSVFTDQPGVQFYIGNFLAGTPDFRGGVKRLLHGAFCLETQTEPDCINHGIGFYNKGEVYRHSTVYRVDRR